MRNAFSQMGTSDSYNMGGRALGISYIPMAEMIPVFSFMPAAKARPAPAILSRRVELTQNSI